MPHHILKIYSEYADKIYDGTKLYELRKDDKGIIAGDSVILVETKPEIIIRGGFLAGNTVKDTPKNIWDKYQELLGISQENYFRYFDNVATAYAIKIDSIFSTNTVKL
jgi:predicted transcriptional regulator